MVGAVGAGHFSGERRFIVVCASILFESERHGLQILGPRFVSKRDDSARINSRGKECAHRHIRDQVMPHRVQQRVVNNLPQCGFAQTPDVPSCIVSCVVKNLRD
jgi:hypothetical protein